MKRITEMKDNSDKNKRCLNCGQHLLGEYCHACGQEDVKTRLSFLDLTRDFLGDMFTYDSRFYRTMVPLLFRPGFLTLEYYRGRRVPYVPPLRLFLFISFLLFLWFASVDTGTVQIGSMSDLPEEVAAELEENASSIPDIVRERPEWLQQQLTQVEQNPNAFLDLMTSRLPYLMFAMLPILAGIIWLHYARSDYNYLQHLVFALHFQSFLYVLTFLVTFANLVVPGSYGGIAVLAVVAYLGMSLRRVFGSTVMGSIGKTVSTLLLYLISLGIAFAGFLYLNLINYG
ncbi:DUF3667 domain-containing protein [Proteobacteria bacterium 005FR1]|nr:DUF3667 domain-containing protein [Proteobacteria bacterium 005FR1]